MPASAPLNASIVATETLQTPEQFANIRCARDGATLRLKDVARVELGGTDYMYLSRVNGQTATGLGIKLAPGSNAVDTTRKIRQTMTELAQYFPAGVTWDIPTRPPPSWRSRSRKVVTTLLEAIALVFCVMYLFMQNFRATLIPTLVVPVALLGTLGVMLGLGYSINVLTMFGMVLAIGILVDDAIVVVERRAHHGRGRPVAARRHGQGHGPDQRRHHRHYRSAGVRVRADGLLRRRGGQYLPSVLGHAGGVDRLLGLPGAVAHAGAVRHHAAAHPGRPPRSAASSAGSTAPSSA